MAETAPVVNARAFATGERGRMVAGGAAAYAVLCLGVALASLNHLPNAPARATVELGLLGLCALATVSFARPLATGPEAYWRLLQVALVAMGWSYAFGAITDFGGGRTASALAGVGLLCALPPLVAALAVYTAAHCRSDHGLTALLDIAILVISLLAITAPPILAPLLHHGGLRALAVGVAWTCDLAIVAGGGWLTLGWLRPRDHPEFAALVALMGGALLVASLQLLLALHGAVIPPWWLTALMGPGYLLGAAAPDALPAVVARRGAPLAWSAGRTWLPVVPAAVLILAALGTVAVGATGGGPRALTGGALVVSALVLARQLLLVHDHRRLLAQRSGQALRDPLTGLLNRRAFNEELRARLRRGPGPGAAFRLTLLDLDRLKEINDGPGGHGAGDTALIDTARALTGAARREDRVYRIGGDEFALLLPRAGRTGAERLVRTALTALAARPEPLTFSAGGASWPDDAGGAPELYDIADRALYQAKRAARPLVLGALAAGPRTA